MIQICSDFQKGKFIALGDFQAHPLQDLIHFFCENDSSVFSRAYDMVQQDGYVMAFTNKLAHASDLIGLSTLRKTTLAQQAAGN